MPTSPGPTWGASRPSSTGRFLQHHACPMAASTTATATRPRPAASARRSPDRAARTIMTAATSCASPARRRRAKGGRASAWRWPMGRTRSGWSAPALLRGGRAACPGHPVQPGRVVLRAQLRGTGVRAGWLRRAEGRADRAACRGRPATTTASAPAPPPASAELRQRLLRGGAAACRGWPPTSAAMTGRRASAAPARSSVAALPSARGAVRLHPPELSRRLLHRRPGRAGRLRGRNHNQVCGRGGARCVACPSGTVCNGGSAAAPPPAARPAPPSAGRGPCGTVNGAACTQDSDCCSANCFSFVCADRVHRVRGQPVR